jgi:hypothetical protein
MQRSLLESLRDEMPRDRLLKTLASLLDAGVALVDADGKLEFQTGPLASAAIKECIETNGAPAILYLDLPGLHGFALPAGDDDANNRAWLILSWRAPRDVPAVAKSAAQLAVPLLDAISRLSRAEAAVTREVRRAALEALLEPNDSDDPHTLNGRCRAFGLELSQGVRAIAITWSVEQRSGPAILDECETALERAQTPFLAVQWRDKIAVVLPATVTDAFLAENLLLGGPTLRAGVGRTAIDALGVANSWADAKLAVEARTRRTLKRIIWYDDLDLGTVLLNEIPIDRLGPKIDELLAPLRDNPLIHETLVSYLRHNQDVGRTARALNLHPNSVRYRLARAESILGVSIRCSSTIVSLHVALVLAGDTGDGYTETGTPAKVAEIHPTKQLSGAPSA